MAISAPVMALGNVAVYIIYSRGQSFLYMLIITIAVQYSFPIKPIIRGNFLPRRSDQAPRNKANPIGITWPAILLYWRKSDTVRYKNEINQYILYIYLENYLVLPGPFASHPYANPNCCTLPRDDHDLLCMLYRCKTHFRWLMSTWRPTCTGTWLVPLLFFDTMVSLLPQEALPRQWIGIF